MCNDKHNVGFNDEEIALTSKEGDLYKVGSEIKKRSITVSCIKLKKWTHTTKDSYNRREHYTRNYHLVQLFSDYPVIVWMEDGKAKAGRTIHL
jgi:hypothetical protein